MIGKKCWFFVFSGWKLFAWWEYLVSAVTYRSFVDVCFCFVFGEWYREQKQIQNCYVIDIMNFMQRLVVFITFFVLVNGKQEPIWTVYNANSCSSVHLYLFLYWKALSFSIGIRFPLASWKGLLATGVTLLQTLLTRLQYANDRCWC
jgi:hypothetical protein